MRGDWLFRNSTFSVWVLALQYALPCVLSDLSYKSFSCPADQMDLERGPLGLLQAHSDTTSRDLLQEMFFVSPLNER